MCIRSLPFFSRSFLLINGVLSCRGFSFVPLAFPLELSLRIFLSSASPDWSLEFELVPYSGVPGLFPSFCLFFSPDRSEANFFPQYQSSRVYSLGPNSVAAGIFCFTFLFGLFLFLSRAGSQPLVFSLLFQWLFPFVSILFPPSPVFVDSTFRDPWPSFSFPL